ncbi:hypothetical protein DFH29DRAFT_809360, partial [Suillus ampliporus]
FLCPVRELKEFSKDADKAQKKLQSGKIKMTASALPAFLWAGDLPGHRLRRRQHVRKACSKVICWKEYAFFFLLCFTLMFL